MLKKKTSGAHMQKQQVEKKQLEHTHAKPSLRQKKRRNAHMQNNHYGKKKEEHKHGINTTKKHKKYQKL